MDTKSKTDLREVPRDSETQESSSDGWHLGRVVRELRQRKVCRASITYVLILWLNLQIGDVLFPMMGFPEWTLQLIMVIGIMGFPVVLLLAWLFQITPDGVMLDLARSQGDTSLDRYMEHLVSLLLLCMSFALTILLAMQFLDAGAAGQALEASALQSACSPP